MSCASSEKLNSTSPVLQHYQFSEVDSLMAKEKRSIAVFLHANWCKFCKNMEQTTFKNDAIVQLLNEQYYFISFDGEQKEEIRFNQRNFAFQPHGRNSGTHELATALGSINGELTYPSFVLLNPQYEITFQHNTFLNAREMKVILEQTNTN